MRKRVRILILAIAIMLVAGGGLLADKIALKGESSAQKRLEGFAHAVNYNNPEVVYTYLTAELRGQITKEKFAENFAHERSYPYLTPFYINFLEVKLTEDKASGVGVFSVAARLPGEIYEQPFVYENGNYYMQAFENIVDGSYVKIFDRLD